MMEEKIKKALQPLRGLNLDQVTRVEIRRALLEYVHEHPVARRKQVVASREWTWYWWRWSAGALAGVLVVVSGTALAAEGSLPGSWLYPVKTGFTEPLRGLVQVSAESRARWQTNLAGRRLTELEQLADKDSLDEPVRVHLETVVQTHAQEAARYVGEVAVTREAESALRIAGELEDSFKQHQKTLSAISQRRAARARSGPHFDLSASTAPQPTRDREMRDEETGGIKKALEYLEKERLRIEAKSSGKVGVPTRTKIKSNF